MDSISVWKPFASDFLVPVSWVLSHLSGSMGPHDSCSLRISSPLFVWHVLHFKFSWQLLFRRTCLTSKGAFNQFVFPLRVVYSQGTVHFFSPNIFLFLCFSLFVNCPFSFLLWFLTFSPLVHKLSCHNLHNNWFFWSLKSLEWTQSY